ncbi:MAG: biotin/lipoyl-containing protein, partial [Rubrivivax sp.]
MALVEVKVPDIGDFEEVQVIEVLVKAGDRVAVEQSLVTVESDKASMEIPSSHAGVVRELLVSRGDNVREGTVLLRLESDGTQAAAASPAATTSPAAPPAVSLVAPAAAPAPVAPPAAAPASVAPGAPQQVQVVVPDIGDFDEVAVIELFVQPGDRVQVDQSLITVESDKASMEIPSSHAGVVQSLSVKIGDKVGKGSAILTLLAAGGMPAPSSAPAAAAAAPAPAPAPALSAPAPAPAPAPSTTAPGATAAAPAAADTGLPHASPSIRRLARELGVPLGEVRGSGPKGRITQDDVQGFVKAVMAGGVQTAAQKAAAPKGAPAAAGGALPGLLPWPQVDFTKFGPVERKDLSRIKKISGANLHR